MILRDSCLGDHGVVQQLLQLVLGAQLEIIGRELGLRGQARRGERRRARLRGGLVALDRAADLAPDVEVQLPEAPRW